MINIFFKNLEKSQLAIDITRERIAKVTEKFPGLKDHTINIFLYMENSLVKAGLDLYGVKIFISGKHYGGIIVEKTSRSLYKALDELADVLPDIVNKKADKTRARNRNDLRAQKNSKRKLIYSEV